jgi:hypothetical protein
MEVIMRLRNFALLGAVLLVFVAFTANSAIAQEEGWPILGTVVQVGSVDGDTYILILDPAGNLWPGLATISAEQEILAVALNAFSIDAQVQGIYNPLDLEWTSFIMLK